MRHKGIASNVIVIGSGVGVNAAVKTKQRKTAVRQGLRIDLPDNNPSKFRATRNSGRTKAIPKIRIKRSTKSRYSSNLTRLPKLSGVKPKRTSTA
jgi:hypothetical protein